MQDKNRWNSITKHLTIYLTGEKKSCTNTYFTPEIFVWDKRDPVVNPSKTASL